MSGVRRFQDLVAWQLCVEQCDVIFAITENGRAASDQEFRIKFEAPPKKRQP